MHQQTLERRLDLLKDECYGYFRKERVERLSVKYGCAKNTIYHDFANKPVCQPLVLEACPISTICTSSFRNCKNTDILSIGLEIKESNSDSRGRIIGLSSLKNLGFSN